MKIAIVFRILKKSHTDMQEDKKRIRLIIIKLNFKNNLAFF